MMSGEPELHLVATTTHGRILIRPARVAAARGLIVGFHGYMESAAIQMERLAAIPGAPSWTLLSVQGLHRFYRGRTEQVVASWMTREDREAAIADNLLYVASAIETTPHDPDKPIVYAGFSQGVAMAFRAAVLGGRRGAAIIAVGGDVPPELLQDSSIRFPPTLLARGTRDEWLTPAMFERDAAAMRSREARITPIVYDGAHDWNEEVARAAGDFLAAL